MSSASLQKLSISKEEAYKLLSKDNLGSLEQMSNGSRSTWLSSYLDMHLPHSKRDNYADISTAFESLDCKRKKRKRRFKSRAAVGSAFRAKDKLTKIDLDSKASYSNYLPLQTLWTQYIEELIVFPKKGNEHQMNLAVAAQKLLKADLHGCPLSVRKSRCPGYVGTSGIVIQETRNMFVMVTPSDQVKRIPKRQSVFNVVLHGYVFTIHGNQLLVKPGDRAGRKFKPKQTIELV